MTALPDGWKQLRLDEISQSVRQTEPIDASREYELWSVPSYAVGRPEDVLGSSMKSGKLVVGEHDVLICKINPRINRVWIVGPNRGRPQVASTEWVVARIIDRSTTSPEYLRFLCTSPDFRDAIMANVSGVTGSHTRARPTEIMSQWIAVPPIDEQYEIVRILDTQLARLDSVLGAVQTIREKAAQFRRSLLRDAFSGRDAEKCSVLADVARIEAGKTPRSLEARLEASPRHDRNIPFYKAGDLNSHPRELRQARLHLASDELTSLGVSMIPAGAIVFPKAGGAIATDKKRVVIRPGGIDLNCMAVIAESIEAEYLFWFFQSIRLTDLADGSIVPQIGKKRLSRLVIPTPERTRQHQVARFLDVQLGHLNKALEMTDRVEVECGRLRRSLLQAAFSGELTREWREGRV